MAQKHANLLVLKKEEKSPATQRSEDLLDELDRAVADVRPARHVSPEPLPASQSLHPLDVWARSARTRQRIRQSSRFLWWDPRGLVSLLPWLVGAAVVVAGLLYVSTNGFRLKSEIVEQGNAAIGSLVSAHDDLKRLDIGAAQKNFEEASVQFQSARDQLGTIGSGMLRLVAALPGGSAARNARNVLAAGEHIAAAGTAVSQAITALTKTGEVLQGREQALRTGNALSVLGDALKQGGAHLRKANALLEDIDPDALPEGAREQLDAFRERLPELLTLIGDGQKTVELLSEATGGDRPHRYLVLFQNSSELRPTGGFPGSYGVLTFEGGHVKDFHADDIYNPDGQVREMILPPQQLRSITPTWGMRDATWFVDFPLSARKVMEFWQKGGGSAVDGVLAVGDSVLADILTVTGPIGLPQYNLVLDAKNVIPELQREVELGINNKKGKPKQVIMDLAPQILNRLASAAPAQWAQLLEVFQAALGRHDMLMYFSDLSLQGIAEKRGWSGSVRETKGDYLQVNVANIKGAKADAVTDTALKLESWLDGGIMVHRLTITRRHNGGTSSYPFYNKPNHSWIRVLVPDGSVLRGISGNSPAAVRTIAIDAQAKIDPDLAALESTYRDERGATRFAESGKTGFGFWLSLDPGKTGAVQVEYAVPANVVARDYHLLVQRQSGLKVSSFEFTLQKQASLRVGPSNPALVEWPDSWRFSTPLNADLDVSVPMR